MTTIQVSLSEAFRDKENLQDKGAYSNSFRATKVTPQQLATHITVGRAWAVGTYTGDHRHEDKFIQSQVIGLDFDNNTSISQCQSVPDMFAHAALYHPTPSHTPEQQKTRVIFILDRPIPDKYKYRKAVVATLHHFRELKPDTSAKDAARFFYGFKTTEHRQYLDNLLSLDTIKLWVDEYETYKAQQAKTDDEQLAAGPALPEVDYKSDAAKAYADKAYKGVLDDLMAASQGERNATLFKATCRLIGFVRGGWPGIGEGRAIADLKSMAHVIGLKESEIKATIASGLKTASPAPMPDLNTPHTPLAEFNPESPEVKQSSLQLQQVTLGTIANDIRAFQKQLRSEDIQHDELMRIAQDVNEHVDRLLTMSGNINESDGTTVIKNAYKLIQESWENPEDVGIKSGIKLLDYALGNFLPGGNYTFLGGTGTGKTTFAATLATAFSHHAPGIVVSCENSPESFMLKMAAYLTRIPYGAIKRGQRAIYENNKLIKRVPLTPDEKSHIRRNMNNLMESGSNITILPEASPTPAVLKSIARRHPEAQWMIVDSLNNMQLPYYSKEYENVTAAALACEAIAMQNDIVVISTAQGGRNTKDRASKQLTLHDAVGSNHVENKAYALITMYNHWYHVTQGDVTRKDSDEQSYPQGTVQFAVRKMRDESSGQRLNIGFLGGCGYYNHSSLK